MMKLKVYSTPSRYDDKETTKTSHVTLHPSISDFGSDNGRRLNSLKRHKPLQFFNIWARKLESKDHKRDCTQRWFHPAPGPFANEPDRKFSRKSMPCARGFNLILTLGQDKSTAYQKFSKLSRPSSGGGQCTKLSLNHTAVGLWKTKGIDSTAVPMPPSIPILYGRVTNDIALQKCDASKHKRLTQTRKGT